MGRPPLRNGTAPPGAHAITAVNVARESRPANRGAPVQRAHLTRAAASLLHGPGASRGRLAVTVQLALVPIESRAQDGRFTTAGPESRLPAGDPDGGQWRLEADGEKQQGC